MVARNLIGLFGGPVVKDPAGEEMTEMAAMATKLFLEAKVALELLPLDNRRVQTLMQRFLKLSLEGKFTLKKE